MNRGSIKRFSQSSIERRVPEEGAFRVAAKRHCQQRAFLVLGVAAAQQSAVSSSAAAAAMTGRTASSCAITSLLS
jgi:hypothetical protein